jgi:carbamoyl-phosphate synthase large subunit
MKTELSVIIISCIKERQGISRLPAALKASGFQVAALCHADSYLAQTKYLDQLIPWTFWSRSSILAKIFKIIQVLESLQPHLVIPADEETILLLHQALKLASFSKVYELSHRVLENSLFNSQYLKKTVVKDAFITFAADLGIRVPQNDVIHSREEALELASKLTFPIVLKQAVGSSGRQVRIYNQMEDLTTDLEKLFHLAFLRKTKREVEAWLKNPLSKVDNFWSIQEYIQGDTAMFVFLAQKGKILGSLPLYKKQTFPDETSPSSVIQSFECPEMLAFAEKLVQKIEFNGFGSIDFIMDAKTQKPYVIEFNPRPVPACHLGKQFNTNFCLLLADYLKDKPIQQSQIISGYTVALFPGEYLRDPASPYLTSAFHDVPWEDQALMKALAPQYIHSEL